AGGAAGRHPPLPQHAAARRSRAAGGRARRKRQKGAAMSGIAIDPVALLRPRRKIEGISAVLLPFAADGGVDWDAFAAHVARTADAGLTPAVNMDTGYVNLLDDAQRNE